jgi:hypothetical protein
MAHSRGLLVALALGVLIGCRPDVTPSNSPPVKARVPDADALDDRVVELYGGPDGLAAVLNPTTIEAFRVNSVWLGLGEDQQIGGYRIVSGPVQVGKPIAAELADILKDSRIYEWDWAGTCSFEPGVAVRFVGRESTVDVLFCFGCEELTIWRNGKHAGREDFYRARTRLAGIFRRVFPDDQTIQQLR